MLIRYGVCGARRRRGADVLHRFLSRLGQSDRSRPTPEEKAKPAGSPDHLRLDVAVAHAGHLWAAIDDAYAVLLPHATLTCIVCGHADMRDGFGMRIDSCIFGGGRLERYACPACDCIFGPKKYLDLREEAVESDYRFLYSYYSEADSTESEIRTFRSLKPQSGQVFLDWGCGGIWSRTVSTLRAEGWDVWGYEPSAPGSGDFVVGRREEISGPFSGIFSNNVIEHFREPVAEFRYFNSILNDGGLMAHSSPCYHEKYTFTRFHTLFLTGRSPDILARRTGFEIVERVEDGDYVDLVFRKTGGWDL